MSTMRAAGRRIHIIDVLRGAAIVYMIFYHLLYDLTYLWHTQWASRLYFGQGDWFLFDATTFILLSGICACFSRDPAKRGARLLVVAGGFTLVTAFIFPGMADYFGILHLISISMLIFAAGRKWLEKLPAWVVLVLSLVLFALTFRVKSGYFGIEGIFTLDVPGALLTNNNLFPFGFITPSYASIDYFPLLPWAFLFIAGTSIGRMLRSAELPDWVYTADFKPLSFLGKHSLLIYIVHQPVMCAILYIIFLFID